MIIDLQRRISEAGRIRIGAKTETSGGKSRPAKLNEFRLTSPDRAKIVAASKLYGGTPQPWEAPSGPQWELFTKTDTIPVVVPPADMTFSMWYELWSAGGCQRRCDGHTETITDNPCLCDPEQRECNIHTRLSVFLADLVGMGVWRLETQGYNAAVELQGAVEIMRLAAGRGQLLPAKLRIEQRMVKRTGLTLRFAVPVLDIEVSPGQLMRNAAVLDAGTLSIEPPNPEITGARRPPNPHLGEVLPHKPPSGGLNSQPPSDSYLYDDQTPVEVPDNWMAPHTPPGGGVSDPPPPPEPGTEIDQEWAMNYGDPGSAMEAGVRPTLVPIEPEIPPKLTPVPKDSSPTPSIANQALTPKQRKPRKKAATPIKATGVKPRTAQQAALKQAVDDGYVSETVLDENIYPPLKDEIDDALTLLQDVGITGTPVDLITGSQLTKLSILLREHVGDDRQTRHDWCTAAIQHPIASAKELTKDEASFLIELLESDNPS